jgi:RNA recognition motif-containing protein
MKIYAGNLSQQVTDSDLRQAFEAFGAVESATVLKDRYSGDSRGFGFVDMSSNTEARTAITGLNGKDLKGSALNVNEARPREDNRGGGGGGRSYGSDRSSGGGNRSRY